MAWVMRRPCLHDLRESMPQTHAEHQLLGRLYTHLPFTAYRLALILFLPQVLSSWQLLRSGIACLLALGLTYQSLDAIKAAQSAAAERMAFDAGQALCNAAGQMHRGGCCSEGGVALICARRLLCEWRGHRPQSLLQGEPLLGR